MVYFLSQGFFQMRIHSLLNLLYQLFLQLCDFEDELLVLFGSFVDQSHHFAQLHTLTPRMRLLASTAPTLRTEQRLFYALLADAHVLNGMGSGTVELRLLAIRRRGVEMFLSLG